MGLEFEKTVLPVEQHPLYKQENTVSISNDYEYQRNQRSHPENTHTQKNPKL